MTGGAAVTICDASENLGGTWTDDDTILFTRSGAPTARLMRVAAAGGTPEDFGALGPVTTRQRWPQALPGGRAVLYSEHSPTATNWDTANLVVAPLSGGAPKVVVRGGYYGRYVPSGPGSPQRGEREGGHLIYLHQGTVFAVPFDLTRLETVGPAVPALEGVTAFPFAGGAKLAVSSEGTLVYVPGTAASAARPIDWLTRDGKTAVLRATNALWANPRFSPNGILLASERQIPRLQRRPWRHRRRPADPAHGGGCHARMDARHAHGISELAGRRNEADVLARRPLDRVRLG